MANLPLAAKLFAGKIVYFAREESGISDLVTKPITSSNKWLQLPGVNSAVHKFEKTTENFDECGVNGWRTGKDEYITADLFELKTPWTTALFEEMRYGLAAAIVQGTPQTPFVKSDRKTRGWFNFQERQQDGQDRNVLSIFVELRAMDPPPSEKKTQETTYEAWVIYSSLQSINFPS